MACPTESKECGDFGGPAHPNIDDDLKYMVIQLCEEVNFLRMTKKESEERMRHLVIEQHKHERQLEDEILKNSILRDKHEQKLLDLDRSYQDDIKRLNREKSKLVWENESWEKDVKSVKDEVRSLQLEKYNLERIIREQSHLLKTQTAAGESCIKQVSIFDEKFKDIKQSLEKCNTQVLILSKEVKEATVLNERLSFINTHNDCMKRKLESKLDEKERIISELTVKTKLKETTSGIKPLEIGAIGFLDKEELKQLKRNEELLKKQLESSHERSKEIRKQLDEAQVLIDKYVTIHVKYKDIVEVMEGEKKEMIEEMMKLEDDRSTEENVVKNLEEEMDQLKVKWNDKEKSLALAVSDQSRNVEALTEENNKLEEKSASLEEAYREILVKMKLHEKQFNENAKNKVDVGINTTIDKFPIEKANMSNCSVQTIDNGAFISSSNEMKTQGTQYSQDDTTGSSDDKFDLSHSDQANLCPTSINKRPKVELTKNPNQEQNYVNTGNEQSLPTIGRSTIHSKQISEDTFEYTGSMEVTDQVNSLTEAPIRHTNNFDHPPQQHRDDDSRQIYKDSCLFEESCKVEIKSGSVTECDMRLLTCEGKNHLVGGDGARPTQVIFGQNTKLPVPRKEGREDLSPKLRDSDVIGILSASNVTGVASDQTCLHSALVIRPCKGNTSECPSDTAEVNDNVSVSAHAPATSVPSPELNRPPSKEHKMDIIIKEKGSDDQLISHCDKGISQIEVSSADEIEEMGKVATSVVFSTTGASESKEIAPNDTIVTVTTKPDAHSRSTASLPGTHWKGWKDSAKTSGDLFSISQFTDIISEPVLYDITADTYPKSSILPKKTADSGKFSMGTGEIGVEYLAESCNAAGRPALKDSQDDFKVSSTFTIRNRNYLVDAANITTSDELERDMSDREIKHSSPKERHETEVTQTQPVTHSTKAFEDSRRLNERSDVKCNQNIAIQRNPKILSNDNIAQLLTSVMSHKTLPAYIHHSKVLPTLVSWPAGTLSTTSCKTTRESSSITRATNNPSQSSQEIKQEPVPDSSLSFNSPQLLTSSGAWLASDRPNQYNLGFTKRNVRVNLKRITGEPQSLSKPTTLTRATDQQNQPSDRISWVATSKPALSDEVKGAQQQVVPIVRHLCQTSLPLKDSIPSMIPDKDPSTTCNSLSVDLQSTDSVKDVTIISDNGKDITDGVLQQSQDNTSSIALQTERTSEPLILDDTSVRSKEADRKDVTLNPSHSRDTRSDLTARKRPQFEDPSEMSLFSDEDEDISSSLNREIEKAQSILNRSRLKRPRRCKPALSISGELQEE